VKKKLLFIVNVDWFFISHRLPIALKALEAGYEKIGVRSCLFPLIHLERRCQVLLFAPDPFNINE